MTNHKSEALLAIWVNIWATSRQRFNMLPELWR